MYSPISFYIAGASLLSTVSAAPVAQASSAPSTNAVPFSSAGFPEPNPAQLLAIELQAHGNLPNGSPPAMISANGITNLQLIEFNENFEVAFFGSLLNNITTNVPGFQVYDAKGRGIVIDALTAILAQEELHALNAEAALTHFGHQHILPCKYVFPTTNFQDAIALAATFTDLVLGTLQDVIELFANANDNALTRGVASVIGQEGEQEGFFRLVRDKKLIPSSQPFLTTSTRDFAFSALQGFVVPGSCPNSDLINLKIFGPLNLATKVVLPQDQTLTFNFDVSTLKVAGLPKDSPLGAGTSLSGYNWNALSVQFINGQNTPISAPLKNIKVSGTVVTFDVFFPLTASLLNGLTIAAVTVGSGPFASANAVALQTLFGPGLIEVN